MIYTIENTKHQREESVGGDRKYKDHLLENQLKKKIAEIKQTVDFSFSNVKKNGQKCSI